MGTVDRGPGAKPLTFRKRRGRQITVAAWLVAALGISAQLLLNWRGAFDHVLIPWLVLASWIIYVLQWRPRLTIAQSGLELCNGVETHYLPYPAIDDVQNRYKVIIKANGKKYVSQVSAPPGSNAVGIETHVSAPYTTMTTNDHGYSGMDQSDQDPVTAAWLRGRLASGQHENRVTTRWNYPLIIFGALNFLWFFLIWLQLRPYGSS